MVTSNSQSSQLVQPLGVFINGLAIVAFIVSLYCCATPGLQVLPSTTIISLFLAPLWFVFFIHLGLMSWMSLWVIVVWSWVICAIRYGNAIRRRGYWVRWWIAPLLLWLLSLVWVTHIPISISFALHKPAFEQLADQVDFHQNKWVDIYRQIGIFHVMGAHELGDGTAPIKPVSLVIKGIGAYQRFIRDPSRKANGFEASTYTLAPGSNNGDQDIYYLGHGWYVFQNYFD